LVGEKEGKKGQQVKFFWLETERLVFALSVLAHRERQRQLKEEQKHQQSSSNLGHQARMQSQYGIEQNGETVSTPPLLLNVIHPGGGGETDDKTADSWVKQLLSYVLPVFNRVASGIEVVKQLLSVLPCEERLLAMVDFEESNPEKFAILNTVAPNWVEWCMG